MICLVILFLVNLQTLYNYFFNPLNFNFNVRPYNPRLYYMYNSTNDIRHFEHSSQMNGNGG